MSIFVLPRFIDRVNVNKVRIYSNRSTVQGHKVTGNYCAHVIGCTG